MQDFGQIVGHEGIIDHLQNSIRAGKVSHAYIFHGEEGMGKKTLAYAFAKTLQCTEGGAVPCTVCKACIQCDSDNHPDIIRVTHERLSIGVDDIRSQVNADIMVKPYSGPYKIYIIDSAEKLTESAQNALLKTIEEPPAYAVIMLLVSNISLILPTILSRCVILNLKPVSSDSIRKLLMEQHKIPDYKAEMAARFSGGNIGKAIRYAASDDFEHKKEDILHILRYIDEMELSEVMSGLKTLSDNKPSIEEYLDFMLLWYRDILMLKATNDPNLVLYKSDYQLIKKQAGLRSYEEIEKIIGAIEKAKIRLKANVNFDIAIELMLLKIKERRNG